MIKSGTEPLIRVMAECESDTLLNEVVDGVVDAVVEASAADALRITNRHSRYGFRVRLGDNNQIAQQLRQNFKGHLASGSQSLLGAHQIYREGKFGSTENTMPASDSI